MTLPRILVTGAGGLLGFRVVRLLENQCHLYLHFHRVPEGGLPPDSMAGDLGEHDMVERLALTFEPQYIINCAALADVDACERDTDLSHRANVQLPANLIDAFPDAQIIHISTDYVFNGDHPGKPEEMPAPINVYGKHKAAGEEIIRKASPRHLIVRTNTMFDHLMRPNFFLFVLKKLSTGKPIEAATDQSSNPISTFNAAGLIVRLIQKKGEGIFHIGGKDFVSRFEFARMIAEYFGLDATLIRPVLTGAIVRPAVRPLIAGLDCTATESFLKLHMPALADQFGWIREEQKRELA